MKAARKKIPLSVRAARILARLGHLRGLSVEEKSVHALGLAATPQERWDLFENSVRSSGCWKRSRPKKSVTRLERIVKSKQAIQRDKDKLHIILIREFLRCRRALTKRK